MADEVSTSTINEVKTSSDGSVKISVEKYNELLEKIANQKGSIDRLNGALTRARNEPPIINRTVVEKTPEILARELRAWGITFMGFGAASFAIGASLYKNGRS